MNFHQTLKTLQEGEFPAHEAEILLLFSLKETTKKTLSRAELFFTPDAAVSDSALNLALALKEKRKTGIPLQYLTHEAHFYGRDFFVNENVLCPRLETEVLIEAVLSEFKNNPTKLGLEIGGGSGIISLTLLAEIPVLKMIATDASPLALEVTEKNARTLLTQPDRLKLILARHASEVFGAWKDSYLHHFDFLISNPPYLESASEMTDEVFKHEPMIALIPESKESLFFYKEIASHARHLLKPKGLVFLELPHERAQAIEHLFQKEGYSTQLIDDITSRPRVLVAKLR